MKISYSNYPILEKLHKGSLGNMPYFAEDKKFFDAYGNFFVDYWKLSVNDFNEDINVISNTFYKATLKAEKSLMNLWEDIAKNDTCDFDVKGCYVFEDFVYMISYKLKKGNDDNEITLYMFDQQGIPLAMFIDSGKNSIHQIGWASSCFRDDILELKTGNDLQNKTQTWIYARIAIIVLFRMFKTYAKVETKIIPPNSKIKDINCKYVNDTKLKLTYLDSKWFTNLVKSDGFNVRGHFRLQPKKENGKWTKELIWISEFQKSGYTAKARVSTQAS